MFEKFLIAVIWPHIKVDTDTHINNIYLWYLYFKMGKSICWAGLGWLLRFGEMSPLNSTLTLFHFYAFLCKMLKHSQHVSRPGYWFFSQTNLLKNNQKFCGLKDAYLRKTLHISYRSSSENLFTICRTWFEKTKQF